MGSPHQKRIGALSLQVVDFRCIGKSKELVC
jgi:hypothetical protein